MADDYVDMEFQNVTFSYAGGAVFTPVTGTLAVDYNATPSPGTATGTLHFSIDGIIPASLSNFTLSLGGTANSYTISSEVFQTTLPIIGPVSAELVMNYNTQTPDHFTSVSLDTSAGDFALTVNPNTLISTNICFAAGTLIRTPQGDAPVESLHAGDLVVTVTGEARPVRWLGRRTLDCRNQLQRRDSLPIRISAGAFGPMKPSHDLYVSPGHAICVDLCGEVFIHAHNLLNGATVAQVEVDSIEYCHVELDSHDVLIANNLPAESFLPMGNRRFFQGASDAPDGEGAERSWADFCRPVVTDRAMLDFVRGRLLMRAREMGWAPSTDPELRLVVDGTVLQPQSLDATAAFLFPAAARDVRLASHAFTPAASGSSDARRLGVMLFGLSFAGTDGGPRRVAIDDARLIDGVYGVEGAGPSRQWRWTNGELVLAPELWAGLSGVVSLCLSYDARHIRKWSAPTAEAQPRKIAERPRLVTAA